MQMPAIESFITRQPWTVGASAHISVARHLMREHGIRHLPVVDNRGLVGIVSERDLHLIARLLGERSPDATVEEAMASEVFTAPLDTPADQVLSGMAARRVGSCVVLDNFGRVAGIFTSVDATKFFADLLRRATSS